MDGASIRAYKVLVGGGASFHLSYLLVHESVSPSSSTKSKFSLVDRNVPKILYHRKLLGFLCQHHHPTSLQSAAYWYEIAQEITYCDALSPSELASGYGRTKERNASSPSRFGNQKERNAAHRGFLEIHYYLHLPNLSCEIYRLRAEMDFLWIFH